MHSKMIAKNTKTNISDWSMDISHGGPLLLLGTRLQGSALLPPVFQKMKRHESRLSSKNKRVEEKN